MCAHVVEQSSVGEELPAGGELLELGRELNANQYRLVHAAAAFDESLEWWQSGAASAALWISQQLQVQSSTAREWIRVGHELRQLRLIDAAFAAQEISYAKVRILTRWADSDNEEELLDLARERSANRLSAAIAKALADGGETDEERDARLYEARSVTTWTDGDGMTVMRVVLPPSVAKPVVAAVDELVRKIAATSPDDDGADHEEPFADGSDRQSAMAANVLDGGQLSADGFDRPCVVARNAESGVELSADGSGRQRVADSPPPVPNAPSVAQAPDLRETLRELRRRWQPANNGDADPDGWVIPSLAQQRADAFVALFMGVNAEVATEVVYHVRGDGITFDDGTPATASALYRLLDNASIRMLIHDAERRPINASGLQRHPTDRQKRVVMEANRHECVDCQTTDLLELDHNPPWEHTKRTVVNELEPRCAPCHRARHRFDAERRHRQVA